MLDLYGGLEVALVAALVFLDEHGAEVGVGDADEVFGAVFEGTSLEAGDAVFGDDVVDIVAGGADGSARREEGFDARDGAARCCGGHGDDALAFARHGGTAHKVYLSSDATVLPHAYGFAGHLPHEVNFEA